MERSDEQGPQTGLTPHLGIRDGRAAEAIDFYKAAFGAEEQMRMPADDGKRLMHAHLTINGASLMLADDFPEYSGKAAGPPEGVHAPPPGRPTPTPRGTARSRRARR